MSNSSNRARRHAHPASPRFDTALQPVLGGQLHGVAGGTCPIATREGVFDLNT